MRIQVNGEARDVEAPLTVGALVDGEVRARRGVAVAVDGQVVRRTEWDDAVLADGATVEIVAAVQGG